MNQLLHGLRDLNKSISTNKTWSQLLLYSLIRQKVVNHFLPKVSNTSTRVNFAPHKNDQLSSVNKTRDSSESEGPISKGSSDLRNCKRVWFVLFQSDSTRRLCRNTLILEIGLFSAFLVLTVRPDLLLVGTCLSLYRDVVVGWTTSLWRIRWYYLKWCSWFDKKDFKVLFSEFTIH